MLPLLAGIAVIPLLVHRLGIERFGLLTVLWIAVGYFSFFDFGLGRALTKLVAERRESPDPQGLSCTVASTLRTLWLLGFGAAVVAGVLSPILVDQVLKTPPGLRSEALVSSLILAASLPFVVTSAGLAGVLQGHQRFRLVAVVRIPLGVANFLGPAILLPWTQSLVAAAAIMAISRFAGWWIYREACLGLHPKAQRVVSPELLAAGRAEQARLLAFGGWATVSNVVGPVITYLDRFIVASALGLGAVAFYATPHEIVTRLGIIATAFAEVVFPLLAAALVIDVARARSVLHDAFVAQLALVFPIVCGVLLFAPEALDQWMGKEFAIQATPVLRWLAVGILINSLARWPFTLLHALGRADLPAKLHLLELPLYAVAAWLLASEFGIQGAACAWMLRTAVDAIALFIGAAAVCPQCRSTLSACGLWGLTAVCVCGLLWLADGSFNKAVVLAATAGVAGVAGLVALPRVGRAAASAQSDNLVPPSPVRPKR